MCPACGIFNTTYKQDIVLLRTKSQKGLLVSFIFILFFIIPILGNNQLINFLNWVGVTVIVALGLQIVTGYCGQISLGQSAFMAVGAYSSAILTNKLGIHFFITLPCAGIIAGIVGLFIGLPSARLKGFYLAIITLAAQIIIPWLIIHLPSNLTGGPYGMEVHPVKIGDMTLITPKQFYPIIMIVTVIMTFFALNIIRTKVGRAFIAIKDNEIAAEVMGVNVKNYKLLAFFISAFFAGIAGSLWAPYMRVIHPDFFTLMESIWFLGMLVIGGLGDITGAFMGVLFVRILEEMVNIYTPRLSEILPGVLGATFVGGILMIIFGAMVAFFLIFEPRGLVHRWYILKTYFRLWPFAY